MEISFVYLSRGYLSKKYSNEADLFERFPEAKKIVLKITYK